MNESQKQQNIDKAKEANKQRLCRRISEFFFSWISLTRIGFRLAEKKKEAEAAVELMTALFERISTDETNKKGLVIKRATYGKLSDEEFDEGKQFRYFVI